MATQPGLNSPPMFLTGGCTPTMDTETYISDLQLYMLASGIDKFPEARKCVVILNLLDPQCRKIVTAAASVSRADDIFSTLSSIYPSAPSVALARQKFNNRQQNDHETVTEFFADLSQLASKCDYGTLEDELIRDKLILGSTDTIKEKLILETPKTKETALETARRIEMIQGELNARTTEAHVNKLGIQSNDTNNKSHGQKLRTLKTQTRNYSQTFSKPARDQFCYRCGKFDHKANCSSCPALGKQCRECGKMNHFSRVCSKNSNNNHYVNVLKNHSPGKFRLGEEQRA